MTMASPSTTGNKLFTFGEAGIPVLVSSNLEYEPAHRVLTLFGCSIYNGLNLLAEGWMQINVAQLLKQPIGASRVYRVEALVDSREEEALSLEGEMRLTRTDQGILVQGTLHTRANLVCSRCLAAFDFPLTLSIQEEFFPTVDVVGGISLPLREGSDAFTIDEHHILDLGEAVRQYTSLAIPLKPLCRPDCAGLCPRCGANLNRGSCQCPSLPSSSQWMERVLSSRGE